MKKTLAGLGMMCLCTAASFASTITGSTSTTSVTFTGFDNGKEKEIDLAGAVAFVGADTCVFQTIGTGNSANSQCLGGNFTITLTPPNSQTGSATWQITNTGAAAITSLTLNVQPANSIFHVCGVAGAVVSGNCNNGGGSVSTINNQGAAIGASVAYSNLATDLVTGGPQPYSPLYGQVTFTWAPGVFTQNLAFDFGANTDFFVNSVPEPATYGMVGLALVGLGALRMRRRSAAKLKRT